MLGYSNEVRDGLGKCCDKDALFKEAFLKTTTSKAAAWLEVEHHVALENRSGWN
jgi:hypothetical protein